MAERLTGGISPEAREALGRIVLPKESERLPYAREERVSLKDVPYMEVLKEQPELERAIGSTMNLLVQAGLEVPVFHITSRAMRLADGSVQSTGYLESIARNGFRARDTNIAALMERGASTRIADPTYFVANPHKFLRAMADSMSRYIHHGSRTNKQTLGEYRETGVGTPVMIAIDVSNQPLIPGSDYDDHFLLGEVAPPSRIVGVVDLNDRKPINPDDVAEVAEDFLRQTEKYMSNTQDGK